MSDEALKEAEGWAELFFGVDQLAVLIGISEDRLRIALENPDDKLGLAIKRGRLLSEAELRKSVIRLAKQGSSPAQAMAIRLLDSMRT